MSLLILGACGPLVPATTPPQLQHTAGAFVSVDAHWLDAGAFRVPYPDGWRIVKASIAHDPVQVVLVAPDNAITLTLSTSPLPTLTETVTLSDTVTVYAYLEAEPNQQAQAEAVWAEMRSQLLAPP